VSTDSDYSKSTSKKLHGMARKTRNGGRAVVARFKHEKFHYMEAYRARIKELRNWTAGKFFMTIWYGVTLI
jgi:hypothetical protein